MDGDRWRAQIESEMVELLRRARFDAWDEGANSAYYDPGTRDLVSYGANPYLKEPK